ncbi:MAG: hypothetical protein Kow00114_37890 [Kiloniellaceae bacterium]
MVASNYRSIAAHRDLRRSGVLPPAVVGARAASKIVIGALIGLVLAVAGSLGDPKDETLPRIETPLAAGGVPANPWGEESR